jgi:CRISPR-associated protein Cas1
MINRNSIPIWKIGAVQYKAPMYVIEPGAYISNRGNRIIIKKNGKILASPPVDTLGQVCLYPGVEISARATAKLLAEQIPIIWFGKRGWFRGITQVSQGNDIYRRICQFNRFTHGDLKLSKIIVLAKLKNCRTLLRRNSKVDVNKELDQLDALIESVASITTLDSLRGIEGNGAKIYFSSFSKMISPNVSPVFRIAGRNKRPPLDPTNSLLSYSYSVLVKESIVSLLSYGLDPFLGFYHTPYFGRPSLALDLIEELRPVVADSLVIQLINRREVIAEDFVIENGKIVLLPKAKKTLLKGFERRMQERVRHNFVGRSVEYRTVHLIQAQMIVNYLKNEIEDYVSLEVR